MTREEPGHLQSGRSEKRERRVLASSCLGTLGFLVLLLCTYLGWEGQLPRLPAAPALPVPNGFDALTAAAAQLSPQSTRVLFASHPNPAAVRKAVAADAAALNSLRKALRLECVVPEGQAARLQSTPLGLNLHETMAAASRIAFEDGRPDLAAGRALDLIELGARLGHGSARFYMHLASASEDEGITAVLPAIPLLSSGQARAAGRQMDRILAEAPEPRVVMQAARRMCAIENRGELSQRPRFSWAYGWQGVWGTAKWWLYPLRSLYEDADAFNESVALEYSKPDPHHKQFAMSRLTAPLGFMFSNLSPSDCLEVIRDQARLRLLRATLALQEYRARYSVYPTSLKGLGANVPPCWQMDPFVERPFVYRRKGAAYLLYSVGPDGIDDGGKPISERDWDTWDPRGDVVLNPNLVR